jgi:hypothetical protein
VGPVPRSVGAVFSASAAFVGLTTPSEGSMHTLTIRTKFTFGDRVRFDSRAQGCSGNGTIFAITIDKEWRIDYIIEIDQGEFSDLQAGILEEEITPWTDGGEARGPAGASG